MILKIVLLVAASLSTIFLVIHFFKGKKYNELVENIDKNDYFLKDLYIIGFSMSSIKLFSLKGKIEKDLKKNAKLVWDNIYYEYYANLAWAQFLTLALIAICAGLILSSLVEEEGTILFLAVTGIMVFAIWNLTISKMKEQVAKRRDECVLEFPNMVSKLSLLINSGMVLREAWFLIANGKEGNLYSLMKKACDKMDNGESDVAAIHQFGVLSDSIEIKKFTSAMIQGIEKGNSELADFLVAQASELWAHKRQLALQKGEVAAGKLIIPLGIMFAGIIMIIVAAAMQSMSF